VGVEGVEGDGFQALPARELRRVLWEVAPLVTSRRRVAVDFEALAAELRRGPTNLDCFDADGDPMEARGVAACRGRQPRQPAGPSVLESRVIEADCS
jgi:hypothetical protein